MIDFGVPVTSPMSDFAGTFNLPEIRSAAIPGAGLIANARSLARHYAMLANGGELDGIHLISKERIKIATSPESEDPKKAEVRWWNAHSLGYTLGGGSGPREGMSHSFGYEGVGTMSFADPDQKFAFAILKNLLDISPSMEMVSATRILQRVKEVLGIA
jgi:CubicO group peptidase (beta-lactamase class C family)